MTEKLTKLHERHSQLCATAHGAGIEVPEDLTRDFDSEEVGRTVCANLDKLIRENNVAVDAETGQTAESAEHPVTTRTAKPKKTAKQKSKKPNPPPDEAAQQSEESNMRKTNKTTKSNARKGVAKKAATKKGAAKKATGTKRGEGKTAKVVALLKRAGGATREDILKVTGWKAVSVQQVAKGAGLKLKVDESSRPFKYKAA